LIKKWLSGNNRMEWTLQVLEKHNVDITITIIYRHLTLSITSVVYGRRTADYEGRQSIHG
jgi:hypothetical protein